MMNKLCVTVGALGICLLTYAGPKHSQETSYPSYKGLIMAGYQGWFRGPQDGTNQGYGHYGAGKLFDEKHCTIDVWPDVSEYEKTYETSFRHADGRKARVFSSADKSTVDLHFKWMKEYGVDGVFVQRFFSYTRGDQQNSVPNRILANALEAASKYDRAIAVMYDLSGLKKSGEDCSLIIEDWKRLVDNQKVTNQAGKKTYLHHNGKPVVAIWGVGFPDRPYNIRNIGLDRLIDFLQNDPVYGGCTVMLGVPTFWRNLEADCINDPYLHTVIKKADIVLPWTVQRFSPLLHNDMDRFRDLVIEDIRWCKENGVDYVPAVTPGFSWHNLSKLEFPDALLKRIMRMNNQDKDEKFVDDNYDKSIEELTWHLIKEQLVKANNIKVEQEDVVNMAKEATRAQFAQYGMMSVPEDLLENYAKEMLKKKESVEGLVNRVVETKLASALKSQVKLNNKTISAEEFNKMFE